jgi:hypothetical protein
VLNLPETCLRSPVEYNPLVGAPAGKCGGAGDEVGEHLTVDVVFMHATGKEKMVEDFVVELGSEKRCKVFGR